VAVGTETDGSITCPAAINHVVGIKPTAGAISGAGIIPIASSQDIAGPMARTVADAELLLDALASEQATQFYKLGGAAERTIKSVVLIRQYDLEYPAIRHMLDQVEKQLKAQGIAVHSSKKFDLDEQAGKDEFAVLIYEYKRDLNQWLEDFKAPTAVNSIAKIHAFNQAKGKSALAFFGQEFFEQADAIDLASQKSAYYQARARNIAAAKGLLDTELARADLIITPAYGPAWLIDHVKGDQFNFGTSSPAAISGYPSLTMPAGFDGELPLGISLIGPPWSEPMLIKFAKSIEQPRVAPKYLPTVPM
jgi:amidase